MHRSVSVKDVAARAGVSLGTVSNVLNRPERVSEATRSRVARAMKELGFVRNESARALRAGRTNAVGYLMLDAANPFFHDVARGVDQVVEEAGLVLLICHSNSSVERERAYVDRLEQQRVRGLLVTPVAADAPEFGGLAERGTPVVFVDRAPSDQDVCAATVDDVVGGRLAARHLVQLGHRRIAFIGGPETLGQVRDRWEGVRRAWRSAKLPAASCRKLVTDALTPADGREAVRRLLELPVAERPTGVVCGNDLVALGVLQEAMGHGLQVPRDLSIVGYDDIEFAAAAAVPLTSVRQPREELGRVAAEMLMDEVAGQDHQHRRARFTPELVVRSSTAPPA